MWKIDQIAYLAGIVDGEGTIYISTRKTRDGSIDWYPRFQIVNTNKPLMDWIHKTFGGHLYSKDRSKHNKNWRMQYEWYTNRKIIDDLLPRVLPYLIVKKPQAQIMLEFRNTFKKRDYYRVSDSTYSLRMKCYEKLRHLNSRGLSVSSAL